jgi:hypothetical protein
MDISKLKNLSIKDLTGDQLDTILNNAGVHLLVDTGRGKAQNKDYEKSKYERLAVLGLVEKSGLGQSYYVTEFGIWVASLIRNNDALMMQAEAKIERSDALKMLDRAKTLKSDANNLLRSSETKRKKSLLLGAEQPEALNTTAAISQTSFEKLQNEFRLVEVGELKDKRNSDYSASESFYSGAD